jgi:CheY-like chemotaxis protein
MNTLLFIEDDDAIRLALRLALEDEGYQVVEAVNGADGLTAFRANEIDLVLLDLRLPDLSGFDVCRALRAESIVPIIIITAQTDTHDMVAGLEAGPTTTSPSRGAQGARCPHPGAAASGAPARGHRSQPAGPLRRRRAAP